ncbi:MAG: DUF1573 domain-containing protein [bacterium]|nr:DUF1573 domain-containing protein [bacterium]
MKTIVSILVVILVAAGILFFTRTGSDKKEVTDHDDIVESYEIYPGAVADKIKNREDFVLLDVRTPEEYEVVHLQGATLLPVQKLSQESLNDINLGQDEKDREIIIYCRSGARSKTAYDIMSSLGYTNIKSIAGGMIHWEEDGYPYTEIGEYNPKEQASMMKDSDGAHISFDRTIHDFGVIPQYGGIVETIFNINNNGNKVLEIGELTTSCSCTSAKISNSSIEPGDSALLTVVFDPDFHEEPLDVFKRTVFIPSNDQNTPEAIVSIQVDIEEGK